MSVKNIVSVFHQLHEMSLEEIQGAGELTMPIHKEMETCAAEAESILKNSVPEEDLVVLMLMVQKVLTATMMANGEGVTILMADAAGELQTYTQTVILTTIGLLIQDEIL